MVRVYGPGCPRPAAHVRSGIGKNMKILALYTLSTLG
jgi:hypothetical protein